MHIIPYHLLLPQTTDYYSTIYIMHSNNHHYIRKINLRFRIQPFWYCRPVIWARQDWPVALDRWLDPSRPWPRRYAFRCWCCRPVTSGLVWQHQRPWWRWFQLKLIFGYFLGSFCERWYGKGNSLWPRASQHVHVSYMFQSSDWHWNLGPCLPETCMELHPPSKTECFKGQLLGSFQQLAPTPSHPHDLPWPAKITVTGKGVDMRVTRKVALLLRYVALSCKMLCIKRTINIYWMLQAEISWKEWMEVCFGGILMNHCINN